MKWKILFAIFSLILFSFCSVENPQSKNNRRNFNVYSFLVNNPIPENLNIVTTQAGNMNLTHTDPKGILLDNENVLVVGNGAELFDQSTLSYTVIPNRTVTRIRHSLTRLQDGRILVLGGNTSAVEIYDSSSMTFTNTGTMIQTFRSFHTATLLPSGKVLVSGGYQTSSSSPVVSSEIYDPATGLFTSTGNQIMRDATIMPLF